MLHVSNSSCRGRSAGNLCSVQKEGTKRFPKLSFFCGNLVRVEGLRFRVGRELGLVIGGLNFLWGLGFRVSVQDAFSAGISSSRLNGPSACGFRVPGLKGLGLRPLSGRGSDTGEPVQTCVLFGVQSLGFSIWGFKVFGLNMLRQRLDLHVL